MLRYRKKYRSMHTIGESQKCLNFSYRTVILLMMFTGNFICASPVSSSENAAENVNATSNATSTDDALTTVLPLPFNLTGQQLQQVIALQKVFNASLDNVCSCEPPCLEQLDLNCPFNRTALRSDCTCCDRPVCSRQIGQSCNNNLLVCDSDLGLTCDNDTNTCSGPYNLRAFDVSHNETVLKWRPQTSSLISNDTSPINLTLWFSDHFDGTGSTKWKQIDLSANDSEQTLVQNLAPNKLFYFRLSADNDKDESQYEILIVQTKDGCVLENSSVGVGERYNVGCKMNCICEENGTSSCSSRCPPSLPSLHPSSPSSSTCREVVDPHDECCKILSCEQREGHALTSNEPQVIVTGRSPDSLTIAWDDFKVPGPTFNQGYVVEYRPVTDDGGQWHTVEVEHGPFTTIGNLTPNTAYEVRVFIWEDVEMKRYGSSTEIIVLSTEDGCIWDSKPLTVGETYNKGCIGRCVCLGNDNSECGPRCSPPYFTKGVAANSSDCEEEPLIDDDCCVLLLCTSKSREDPITTFTQLDVTTTSTAPTTTMDLATLTTTVDSATPITTVNSTIPLTTLTSLGECPVNVPDATGFCVSDCKTDNDCISGKRCCLSDCGSQLCIATKNKLTPTAIPDSDLCTGVTCGPNAVCHHYNRNAQCYCLPGTSGNPFDITNGCLKVVDILSNTTIPVADPCKGITCGPNAVCHHYKGNAQCYCLPGTSGNPNDISNGCLNVRDTLNKVTVTTSSSVTTAAVSPCLGVKCGPNAVCHHYKDIAKCYCLPGASGNPDDSVNGCLIIKEVLKEKSKIGCVFGNDTYAAGETFYRGCDEKCNCALFDNKFEILCQPRCSRLEERPFNFDETCHIEVDPNDECCKKLICKSFFGNDSDQETKNKTLLVGDGCEYNGKIYKRDEHFYEGCENSCHCLGGGEVTCNPRCPPLPAQKPGCVTMPHPSDSECCSLIICNPFNLNFTISRPTLDDEETLDHNGTVRVNSTILNNATLFNVSSLFGESDKLDSMDNVQNENFTTDSNFENSTITTVDTDGMETLITIIHSNHSVHNLSNPENSFNVTFTEESIFNGTDNSTVTSRNSHNIFNVSDDDIASIFEDSEDLANTTHLFSDDGNFTDAVNETSVNGTDSFGNSTITPSNLTEFINGLRETSTIELETASESSENNTKSQKEVRLLQEVDSQAVEFPKHIGRLADIYRILLIDATTIRLQILLAPSIMEKIFTDSDTVFVLFTNNLTHTDLVDWSRYPLSLQNNLAFVSVDRSDTAAEIIVTDLEPNRQYNFMVVLQKENLDPDAGFQYQQLSDIEATVTVRLGDGMCEFMGKTFNIGERLYDECQAVCDCIEGPNAPMVNCEAILCPHQINPDKSGCLEWNVDLAFIPRAPHCCADATCKYGSVCLHKGKKFRNLAKIPQSLVDDCEQECTCVAGNVTCVSRCASFSTVPPEAPCNGVYEQKVTSGDYCCKSWECVKEETTGVNSSLSVEETSTSVPHVIETTSEEFNATSVRSVEQIHEHDNQTLVADPTVTLPQPECTYDNGTYKLNEQWRVGKGHRQKLCTCLLMHNGSAGVECQGGCPSIVKQSVDLIPDCPPENVIIWDVPELCPYVVCNKSDIGRGVKNVTVDMLNATAIRVTFVIPNIYVGLYGQIEILYTMDLTHSDDTTTWNKEVFSGPSNQFENTRLSHEMTGLQPDTEYYLKVLVVIKNSKNMDSSDIITIKMPPLPTTTTTTTTTTLPPKIYLDPKLSVSDITTSSAKINWRSFDSAEKRYVDGVQLHYKLHSDDTQQWSQTLLIHRDVVFYTMEHLKPNSEYDVNIVVVTLPNVSTEILVGEPITFKTLAIFDDYEFNLTLTVDKTTPYSVDLIWTGVQYPEHKYVNVYKILYQKQNGKDIEPSFIYQPPKGNQFQSRVDNLLPETNYTIWMEAFLTNGKIRSSNVITVSTKVGLPIANQSEKEKLEASSENSGKPGSNAYYAALIVVAVIAALCALGFVILLVILLRKQSSAKAPITTTKSHSAYDNPTYKVC
ncbi:hypothetical protein CHUAL_009060 [Chamberlinius hualienensis]